MKRITVYCGSNSGASPEYKEKAFEMGLALAKRNLSLIYGGAHVGLMGAVADGVLESGGEAIGVIPSFLQKKELAHLGLSEIIVVNTMHERKAKMSELCDGFIALPGGFGTLEELFEMLTWAQLSLHSKPIGLLNIHGYYDMLIEFIDQSIKEQFVKGDYRRLFIVDDDPVSLLNKMDVYNPPLNDKWFVTT